MIEIKEMWLDIPNYEGLYQVSNSGNVKGLSRTVKHSNGGDKKLKEKILSYSLSSSKYLTVRLCKDGKCFTKAVHKLVAIAFLNHIPKGMKFIVIHENGLKTDNTLDNLKVIVNKTKLK